MAVSNRALISQRAFLTKSLASLLVAQALLVFVSVAIVIDPMRKVAVKIADGILSHNELCSVKEFLGSTSGCSQFAAHNAAHFEPGYLEPVVVMPGKISVPFPEKIIPGGESNATSRAVEYQVSAGDTWSSLWARVGARPSGATHALKAIRALPAEAGDSSMATLRIGETVTLFVDTAGDQPHVASLVRYLTDGRSLLLSADSENSFRVHVLPARSSEMTRVVTGTIQSSFSLAARQAQVPLEVVDDFVDLFSSRVEFRRDLQPGDSFTIEFAERRCGRSGVLLPGPSIASASLMNSGKLLAAIRHGDEGSEAHYFDERGEALGNHFLRYPLQFTRISSAFSYARFHPVLKRTRPHNGVDFAAPHGTPVRAVADGIVEIAGYRGEAGNMIRIQHSERYATAYLHLASIASGVRPGARLSRGQVIGAVGSTGLSTGPHLHFSLFDRGKYVDPLSTALPALTDSIRPIPNGILLAALENIKLRHNAVMVASIADGVKSLS